MDEPRSTADSGIRRDPRVSMAEQVTISFAAGSVVGPGKNISAQGVYFVAETSIRVQVRIEGLDTEVAGELVRVESMGDGKVGIAVRFDEPYAALFG